MEAALTMGMEVMVMVELLWSMGKLSKAEKYVISWNFGPGRITFLNLVKDL